MNTPTQDAPPGNVQLRDVTQADLSIFFEQQRDPDANYMAAFTAKDPTDRDSFDARWSKIMGDASIIKKTILYDGQVAGSISSFLFFGEVTVGYWLGKEFWGKGIATQALTQFIRDISARPLYARVAKDNLASQRVLQKCGFIIAGEDKGFANARGAETEEFILLLAD